MFDKIKDFLGAAADFFGAPPKTEPAHFEHWICQGVAADGTEFEHEGGWVLVSDLVSKDAIPWLMTKVKNAGYFRDAHMVFPLTTVVSADWQKIGDNYGVIPYCECRLQVDYTHTQMVEKLAAGEKLKGI